MHRSGSRVKPLDYQPSLIPEDEWLTLDVRVHLVGRKTVQVGFWVRDEWREHTLAAESGRPVALTLPDHPSREVSELVLEFLREYADPF